MGGKRPSLASSRLRTPGQLLKPGGAAPQPEESTAPTEPAAPVAAPAEPTQTEADNPKRKRPLKERAKQMILYVRPDAHKQLKQLAASEDVQLNDLVVEALNLLFKDRQLPQIAEPEGD